MPYPAWLLPVSSDGFAAIGKFELRHIESVSAPVDIPSAPDYCNQVMQWQSLLLPLFNTAKFVKKSVEVSAVGSVSAKEGDKPPLTAIVAYQASSGSKILYGGILIADMPTLIHVEQRQAKQTQELPGNWQSISHGAFEFENRLTPILDLRTMLSLTPSELSAQPISDPIC